jgi:hypothetical protein
MEAASRPSLEPLPDLPVEAPLDTPAPKPTAAGAAGDTSAPKSVEQTGITLLDPASLVLDGGAVPPEAPPVLAAAPSTAPPSGEYELTLEDPVVDEMLTAPPPPPVVKSAPPVSAPPVTPAAPEPARTEGRVPIARTASLSSAASKLAAASRRVSEQSPPKPVAAPAAHPAAAPAKASKTPAAPAGGTPAQAQSLADWTSARTAASSAPAAAPAPKLKSPPPAAATATPKATVPPPKAAAAPAPAPAAPASSPPAAAVTASAPMDKDFIARNQVVERYLSGRLPLKGATEFEQYCARHPELLDEIGLPERVNAGLRLLEASGKPEPWQEAPRPVWQKPQVTVGLAAVAIVCGIAAAVLAGAGSSRLHRIEQLQKQLAEQPLDPATSTREIRLLPSREGASNSPAITIGGGSAQMADMKIDESRSPYHIFRVTIDRIDQGRVGVINNLVKDSNGHLRIALNSSALGPGNYQLTIEGVDWRGDPQPDSWVTVGVAR